MSLAGLNLAGLNVEQRAFFDSIMEDPTAPRLFFLTGVAGTSKTHTYNTPISYCMSISINVVVSAYIGIVANLLIKGIISHKAYGLPFQDAGLNMNKSNIHLQSKEADRLRECKIVIWDESTMVNAWMLHVADDILRQVTQKLDDLFGNKIVVLGGDFHQILPTNQRIPSRHSGCNYHFLQSVAPLQGRQTDS